MSKTTIEVQGVTITVVNRNNHDYISLTDIARYRNSQEPFAIINNWMRSRSTIEFLGLWEKLSNPGFKPLEFERFKTEAGPGMCKLPSYASPASAPAFHRGTAHAQQYAAGATSLTGCCLGSNIEASCTLLPGTATVPCAKSSMPSAP
jgi:hypothetical protein